MRKFRDFKIFAADKIHPSGISMLRKSGFKVYENYWLKNSDLIEFIKKKTFPADSFSCLIIRSVRTFSESDIEKLSEISVKTICTASSGFDNIPVKACKKHNIKVLNVPEGNYVSAAEHTIALLLNIMKNINKADVDMKSGKFESLKYTNYELTGKTIGIIGVGRVGSHLAKLCRAFGVKILGNDIKKTLAFKYNWIIFKKLDDLLKESDIITVHTPLDTSTVNLISSEKLRFLKKNAIILNCARGGIINEKALIRNLKRGKIYYAGIDVFENEPDIKKDFRRLHNVLLTPHQAGKTVESKVRISVQLAERIIEFYAKKYQ